MTAPAPAPTPPSTSRWNPLLPSRLTEQYRGLRAPVWALAALTLVSLGRSLTHMFSADGGAQSIASIPLDTFGDAAADAVVFVFAFWGLSQLMMALVYVVVLWRYQALVPLMWLFVLLEYLGRWGIGQVRPIETVSTAPGEIANFVLIPLAIMMIVLAMRRRRSPSAAPSPSPSPSSASESA